MWRLKSHFDSFLRDNIPRSCTRSKSWCEMCTLSWSMHMYSLSDLDTSKKCSVEPPRHRRKNSRKQLGGPCDVLTQRQGRSRAHLSARAAAASAAYCCCSFLRWGLDASNSSCATGQLPVSSECHDRKVTEVGPAGAPCSAPCRPALKASLNPTVAGSKVLKQDQRCSNSSAFLRNASL